MTLKTHEPLVGALGNQFAHCPRGMTRRDGKSKARPNAPMIPLALELLGRYLAGEPAETLATEIGIPVQGVEQRLRLAAAYIGTPFDNPTPIRTVPIRHYAVHVNRAGIEHLLRKRIDDAGTRVAQASLNFDTATASVQCHENNSPDGIHSLRQCSVELKIAHEEYREALHELIDFLKNKALPR